MPEAPKKKKHALAQIDSGSSDFAKYQKIIVQLLPHSFVNEWLIDQFRIIGFVIPDTNRINRVIHWISLLINCAIG